MKNPVIAPTLPLPFLNGGMTQIATLVENLDRVVENYWRLFGVGPWHFYTYAKPLVRKMSYQGQPADYAIRLALSNAGPTRIELIQHLRGESVYTDFIARHGYGVQHVGLLVEDMHIALEQSAAAGFHVVMDGYGFGLDGDGGYAYLDTEERLGVMIELIERPKRRHIPEKIYPHPNA